MDGRDYAQQFPLTVFSLVRPDDQLPQGVGRLLGRGVEFPSGMIVIDWNQDAYPPEQRLRNNHHSVYWSFDDLELASRAEIVVEGEI